jgi:uncharacterized iron-regulated membrane protein
MTALRKILFWFHLLCALTAGVVVLTMSVTGIALAFERQIVSALEGDLRADPSSGPADIPAAIAAAQARRDGARPSAVILRSEPTSPLTVSFGREGALFVDQYSQRVLGAGAVQARAFFKRNEDLHRWLAFSGPSRDTGRAITGAANFVFLFIIFTGLYLWWPRNGSFRAITWFRSGLRSKARDFNWHNVLGLWSSLPLIAIVFSAVVISYPWAGDLVYRALGDTPPAERGPRRDADRGGVKGDAGIIFTAAVAEANRSTPDWQSLTLRLPAGERATVNVDRGNGARPDKRSQLTIDGRSGEIVGFESYASQSAGRQARSWLRWIHTGEAGGIIGQFVAALASGAAVVLVWTGFALAFRRFRAWASRIELPRISRVEESET